jgi:hypothetical protein
VAGTTGVWTVLETTQRTPPSHNVAAPRHTEYRGSPASPNTTWFLLIVGAVCIAAIFVWNSQVRKNRTRQE